MKMHLYLCLLGSAMYNIALAATTFELDCNGCIMSCNNDCYGVFNLDFPDTLHWDKPSEDTRNDRRKAVGCDPSPCGDGGKTPWNKGGPSCDEYPYASTTDGGKEGGSLRCVDTDDNANEGGKAGGHFTKKKENGGCGDEECDFTVFMINFDDAPFCKNMGGANDGLQFKYVGGQYSDAKLKRTVDTSHYVPFNPDPALAFPLEKRREFMLNTGERALYLGRNNIDWVALNQTIASDAGPKFLIRELFGDEKSPNFRPRG